MAARGLWTARSCSWLLVAARGCSWLLVVCGQLVAARGCSWLLVVGGLLVVARGCSWLLVVCGQLVAARGCWWLLVVGARGRWTARGCSWLLGFSWSASSHEQPQAVHRARAATSSEPRRELALRVKVKRQNSNWNQKTFHTGGTAQRAEVRQVEHR